MRICAGTDAALPLNPAQSLQWEVEWLERCGLEPVEAIRAGTVNNGRLLRRPDLGVIAPGAVGDLILVDGDPREDVRRLRNPSMVIQSGAVVARDQVLVNDQPFVSDNRHFPQGPFASDRS